MYAWLKNIIDSSKSTKKVAILERPMINSTRFKQSISAARAFEATLIVLEKLGLKKDYIIIDSKKWQHWLFGNNTVLLDLKVESMQKGLEYFNSKNNEIYETIKKHGDADSFFICLYAKENLI